LFGPDEVGIGEAADVSVDEAASSSLSLRRIITDSDGKPIGEESNDGIRSLSESTPKQVSERIAANGAKVDVPSMMVICTTLRMGEQVFA
jgi:hypothetical protein